MKFFGPVDEEALACAPEIVFHHIGETRDPASLLRSALTVVPTATVDDCPELSCLSRWAQPGPFLSSTKVCQVHSASCCCWETPFTTCTEAALVAATGVLDGKRATINNLEYNWVVEKYPNVKWTKEKKWIVDENIWTGSGAVSGMDMFAHWLEENFGLDVIKQGSLFLDYETRDSDGLFNVLSQRYDPTGRKISTDVFP